MPQPSLAPTCDEPITGTVDCTGLIATKLPGTVVASGASVTSLLDPNNGDGDFYQIQLQVGETLLVELDTVEGSGYPQPGIAYPGSAKAGTLPRDVQWHGLPSGGWLASRTGDYTLYVEPTNSSETFRYKATFTIQPADPTGPCDEPITGTVDCTGLIATKLPGTVVASGASVTSLLDPNNGDGDFYRDRRPPGGRDPPSGAGHRRGLRLPTAGDRVPGERQGRDPLPGCAVARLAERRLARVQDRDYTLYVEPTNSSEAFRYKATFTIQK